MNSRFLPQPPQPPRSRRPALGDSSSDDDVYEEMGDTDLMTTPVLSRDRRSPNTIEEYEEYMDLLGDADTALSVLDGVRSDPTSNAKPELKSVAPEQWTIRQVSQFLEQLGLGEYSSKFMQQSLDGNLISWLDHDDLRDLGMAPLGHRVTFLAALESFTRNQNTGMADSDDSTGMGGSTTPSRKDSQQTLTESSSGRRTNTDTNLLQRLASTEKRLAATEQQLEKLGESYHRLRSVIMPVVRRIKEDEPLPTPAGSSQRRLTHSYSSNSVPRVSKRGSLTSPVASSHLQQSGAASSSTLTGPEPSSSALKQTGQSSASLAVIPPFDVASPRSASSFGPNSADSFGDTTTTTSPEHIHHHRQSQNASAEAKKFKVTIDQPCIDVLPMVLKKYKIEGNPEHYRLLVSYGDQERELSRDEKPFVVYRELQVAGLKPVFVVRQIHDTTGVTPTVRTPGGII